MLQCCCCCLLVPTDLLCEFMAGEVMREPSMQVLPVLKYFIGRGKSMNFLVRNKWRNYEEIGKLTDTPLLLFSSLKVSPPWTRRSQVVFRSHRAVRHGSAPLQQRMHQTLLTFFKAYVHASRKDIVSTSNEVVASGKL